MVHTSSQGRWHVEKKRESRTILGTNRTRPTSDIHYGHVCNLLGRYDGSPKSLWGKEERKERVKLRQKCLVVFWILARYLASTPYIMACTQGCQNANAR